MVTEKKNPNNQTTDAADEEHVEIRLVRDAARMIRLGELRFAADVLEVLSLSLEFGARVVANLEQSGRLTGPPGIAGEIERLAAGAETVKSASVMVGAVAGEGRVQTPEGGRSLAEQVDIVGDLLAIAIRSFRGVQLEIRNEVEGE